MTAVLISIGDELLSGTTVDTNSNYIAAELLKTGIPVRQIFTISDDVDTIKRTMGHAMDIADLVITTGGLGPTNDDRTKTAYKEYFEDKLIQDSATFAHLSQLLTARKRQHLIELNRQQADVLSKAIVFQNDYGTAPCQMVRENGKIAICLPGVPYEVKPLLTEKIIPYFQREFKLLSVAERAISVVDFPESELAAHLTEWERALPEDVRLSYLPCGNRVVLKLTATGGELSELQQELDALAGKLQPLIAEKAIGWNGTRIEEVLNEVLAAKKLTISSAESCTGGAVARMMTAVAGCGTYFLGGAVTYEVSKKTDILNVPADLIEEKGVVSAEVAQAMSEGCQRLFKSDIAVSTTGAAGPGTDEFNTPVGEVFYSIRIKESEKTNRLFLPHFHRNDFMNFVAQRVLQDVIDMVIHDGV